MTPGWMAAVSAGAHAARTFLGLAAAAGCAVTRPAASTALAMTESTAATRRVPFEVKLMEMVPPCDGAVGVAAAADNPCNEDWPERVTSDSPDGPCPGTG